MKRKMKKEVPQEVMVEILLRLPVKSLLRFKCVCKHWLSLISDPNFAKQHFQLSMNPSHKILYITDSLAWSWDFNAPLLNHSALSTIHLPSAFIPPRVYWMRIVGSCRGFLLIALNDNILLNDLIIWNPTTGSCKKVPPPPTWDNKFVFLCGLGYDASTDDYIIVQISYQNWEGNQEVIIFETFSVKSNSWKEVDVRGLNCTYGNLRNDDVDTPRVGSFLNGSIHWLALRMDDQRENPSDSETVIIAFDLNEKSKNAVKDLAVPDDFLHQYSDLGVFGGCLGLIEWNEPGKIIYVMKEYGVKSSWVSLITLSLDNIPFECFSPMFLCKDGEVVGVSGYKIVKYSDKGGELLEPELLELPNPNRHERYYLDSTAIVYTETLLSLPSNHGD